MAGDAARARFVFRQEFRLMSVSNLWSSNALRAVCGIRWDDLQRAIVLGTSFG